MPPITNTGGSKNFRNDSDIADGNCKKKTECNSRWDNFNLQLVQPGLRKLRARVSENEGALKAVKKPLKLDASYPAVFDWLARLISKGALFLFVGRH